MICPDKRGERKRERERLSSLVINKHSYMDVGFTTYHFNSCFQLIIMSLLNKALSCGHNILALKVDAKSFNYFFFQFSSLIIHILNKQTIMQFVSPLNDILVVNQCILLN